MTYQPYPGGGASNVTQQPRPAAQRPRSVRIAAILMYVGGALSAVSLIVTLVFIHRLQSAIATSLRHSKIHHYTAAQIHRAQTTGVVAIVVVLLIIVGLWVWMAWINNRGASWARIVASVLFGLNTVWFLLSLRSVGGPSVYYGLGWIIGLAALILLWRRDATAYIQQQSQRPGPVGPYGGAYGA